MRRREAWFESQIDLDPERLVFIDETWASTAMARRYGRAPRGQRLRVGVPYGHWKTTTFVAGLRVSGVVAPFVLDGPINRNAFETYVEKVLLPELRPGEIVIMDNLSSHKGPNVRCSERPPNEASKGFGLPSGNSSPASRPPNAQTISPLRPGAARPTTASWHSLRSLEDDHVRGRAARKRRGRAVCSRRSHQP